MSPADGEPLSVSLKEKIISDIQRILLINKHRLKKTMVNGKMIL